MGSTYILDGVVMESKAVSVSDTAQLLPTAYMGAAATSITDSTQRRANAVLVQAQAYPVRIRWGGGVPTASNGLYLAANDTFKIEDRSAVETLRFINATALSNATLEIIPFCKPHIT